MTSAAMLLLAMTATASPALPDPGETTLRVPWTEPSGQSLAVSYDNGSWGGNWTQSLRLFVPFSDHFGALARGLVMFGSGQAFADRIDLGCDPGSVWHEVCDVVSALCDQGHRVSIDSFSPPEFAAAEKAGADLVLSVNRTNRQQAADWAGT